MQIAVLFVQWESYCGKDDASCLFAADPLSYNSRQERLHTLAPGDQLWLVARAPDDRQYYFVAVLTVAALRSNTSGTSEHDNYGEFAVVADREQSRDLHKRFPAEGLLRSFEFESSKPIKYGASIGQSLQTLRFLDPVDVDLLTRALQRLESQVDGSHDPPAGLWTKCDRFFADYFLNDWRARRKPQAFLLYDAPPILAPGAPVFIHSDKHLRLLARVRESQYVAGHRFTCEPEERLAERERIWTNWRAGTLDHESRSDFDRFWEKQHGVRALIVIEDVIEYDPTIQFKYYGRALEWGYPTGVGYRYLTLSQSWLLLRQVQREVSAQYLDAICAP